MDWKSGLTEAGKRATGLIGDADTVSLPPGFERSGNDPGNETGPLRHIAVGGFIGNEDPALYHALKQLKNSRFMQSPSLPPGYLKAIEDAFARGRIEIRDLPDDTLAVYHPASDKINIRNRYWPRTLPQGSQETDLAEYLPGLLAHEGYHRYMRGLGLEYNLNEEEMAHILKNIIDLEMNPGKKNLYPLSEEGLARIKEDYKADNGKLKDIGDVFDPFPQ